MQKLNWGKHGNINDLVTALNKTPQKTTFHGKLPQTQRLDN